MKKRIAHSIFNSKNAIQWSSSVLQTIIKMGRCIKKYQIWGERYCLLYYLLKTTWEIQHNTKVAKQIQTQCSPQVLNFLPITKILKICVFRCLELHLASLKL